MKLPRMIHKTGAAFRRRGALSVFQTITVYESGPTSLSLSIEQKKRAAFDSKRRVAV